MKTFLILALLAVSVTANGIILYRRVTTTTSLTAVKQATASVPVATTDDARRPTVPPVPGGSQGDAELGPLVAALRAAGWPEHLVRAFVGAQIDEQFRAREAALHPSRKKLKFWQQDDTPVPWQTRLALLDLQREKARLRVQMLGPDPATDERGNRFDHLPPAKRDLARQITEDYTAMLETVRTEAGTLPLATDRERIKYLEAERRRDLAALLTPEELAEHDRRFSPFAERIRDQLRYFDATPAEEQAIFAAQSIQLPMRSSILGEEFAVAATPEAQRQQEAQAAQANEQLKAALGPARYEEYLRAKNYEFQQLSDLTTRAGLPDGAATQVFGVRDAASTESNRILADLALTDDQKRAALKLLADNTRAQIGAVIGPVAADAYTKTARWLKQFEEGAAVTFRGDSGTSARFVGGRPPPRGGAPKN
jgi:hypothetical protein